MKTAPTYASIIPLIGGETIGVMNSFQTLPEYMISYKAFEANDSHLVNYLRKEKGWQGDYIAIDENKAYVPKNVDVINSVCPCAGLSSLSSSSGSDNAANDWMIESSEYVLKNIGPKVLFGENAPRLATASGAPVVDRLRKVAKDNGYVFSIVQTHSGLHGLPQVRNRSFYFFWKGSKIPQFNWVEKERETFEELLAEPRREDDPMNVVFKESDIPSDPYVRYILEVLHEGKLTFKEFYDSLDKTIELAGYAESHPKFESYYEVADWMEAQGFDKKAKRARAMQAKLDIGGGVMKREMLIPKTSINAFVGHLPHGLINPVEMRHLTYRECLSIMKMPDDFQLLKPKASLNHICQNVPVTTAQDMADYVKAHLQGEIVDYFNEEYVTFNNLKQTTKVHND
jgi:site-specific DNA-cytosine methylase